MAVPNGAVIRAAARWDGVHDQDIVNVWTFKCDFAASQLEEDVYDAVDAYLTGVFQPFDDDLYQTITPRDLKVDVVTFTGGKWVVTANVGFGAWGAGIATTETADPLPPGASVVGFLRTDLGKHQGRKFFGGFAEDQNSPSGAVGSDVITRVVTGLLTLLTPYLISAGNEIVSVVLDTLDGTIREVTSVLCNTHWGYQRRRRPGVGS